MKAHVGVQRAQLATFIWVPHGTLKIKRTRIHEGPFGSPKGTASNLKRLF